jgi:hypothetical protein
MGWDQSKQTSADHLSRQLRYGLHLNGDPSPWDELLPGGRFERLTNLVEIDDIHRNGSESK